MKKVLYVDSQRDVRDVITNIFPKENYRVIFATDGVEGMMKFRNESFDIVITDYRLPRMDGLKFFQQMREFQNSRKQEHVPVLFVSSDVAEMRAKQQRWERCDFLDRPFQPYELISKVGKLLGGNGPRSESKIETRVTLVAGETLFREGDEAHVMYIVLSGVFAAYKANAAGGESEVGRVFAGELLGEMGVLDGSCRCMTVVALEPAELLVVPARKVREIVEGQHKWVKLMLETMNKRLKQALKQIA